MHPTGLALALTSGVVYTICAVVAGLWPRALLKLMSTWIHTLDLQKVSFEQSGNLQSFIVGLVSIMVFFYVVGVLFAWLYNGCVKHCIRKKWISSRK